MAEGTKLGNREDLEFDKQVSPEKSETIKGELRATKIGELSEFERSLYTSEKRASSGSEVSASVQEEQGVEEAPKAKPEKKAKSPAAVVELGFEDQLARSIVDYQEGDVVKGVVRSVEKSGVMVDIFYKSDGFVPNAEFSPDPSETPSTAGVKTGDILDVFIEKLETKEGYCQLSRKKAVYELTWENLVKLSKTREPIEVKVTSRVEGGLVVNFRGIKGFIPASHLGGDVKEVSDDLIGQTVVTTVLNADRKRRKVIFSNRLGKSKYSDVDTQKLIDEIEAGQVRRGKVSSIKDFGAFVEMGGNIEGLVHISELSWSRVNHPSEVLSVGQELDVFVLGVDREHQKISLGLKQLQPDPWAKVAEHYKVGQIVEGVITRVVNFGAFMQIEKNLEGLIHISELANSHINQVSDIVKPGDRIKAKIIKLQPEGQKIGLSLKGVGDGNGVEHSQSADSVAS